MIFIVYLPRLEKFFMKLTFYKYQGTGNDFILIDNRSLLFKKDAKSIEKLCDRKFGIGADGLILLETSKNPSDDFSMVYFNADGKESSMCGNGGRCIAAFAKKLGLVEKEAKFSAIDGEHLAVLDGETIRLKMMDVNEIEDLGNGYFLDTGSPHHVLFTEEVGLLNVKSEGAKIRYSEKYGEEGTNVNFVQGKEAVFIVRTYERGVEDETLSCGTGAVAVALAVYFSGKTSLNKINLETLGGNLSVNFEKSGKAYTNIWLNGPAEQVFKGEIEV